MIAPQNTNTAVASANFRTAKFRIKDTGMAHILHLLRNSTYSDKILAVIREYSCNAADANIEAGNGKKPIEISLPTKLSPSFKIRDFGTGLTFDEINEIFCCYGESTKRGTNTQVGMMGIGCKSGFAYGDNFLVITYKAGVKTICNCYLEASGCGEVAEMSVEKTEEPNGVEVVIPVKQDDVKEFEEKAVEFFKWWEVKPIIHGLSKTPDWKKLTNADDIIMSGAAGNWHLTNRGYYSSEDSLVIMGNVAYPMDSGSMGSLPSEEESLIRNGIVLRVPIGSVEVANSREALQYSDFTIKNLRAQFAAILKEVQGVLVKEFSVAKNMIEAKEVLATKVRGNPFLRRFEGLAIWNGNPVKGISLHKPEGLTYTRYNRKGQGTNLFRTSRRQRYSLECGNTLFLVRDTSSKISARIFGLFDSNPSVNTIYLLTFDGTSKSEFKKENHFNPDDFQKISTVTPHAAFAYPKKAAGGVRSGFATGVYTASFEQGGWVYHAWRRRRFSSRSEGWEQTATIPASGGVYVELNKYAVVLNGNPHEDLSDIKGTLAAFQTLGLLKLSDLKLYGATKARVKHFKGDKWMTLTAYLAKLLEKHIKENGITSTETDLMQKITEMGWGKAIVNESFLSYLPATHPIVAAGNLVKSKKGGLEKMKAVRDILQSNLGRALRIEIPSGTTDIEQTFKAFNEAYPLAKESFADSGYGRNPWKLIADYVLAMDELKQLKSEKAAQKKTS